jgi:hypothetical protein
VSGPDLDRVAPVDLSLRELRVLARAMKQYRRKLERDLAKSTFVPAPGHSNVSELNLALAVNLEKYIRDQVSDRFQEEIKAGRITGAVRID